MQIWKKNTKNYSRYCSKVCLYKICDFATHRLVVKEIFITKKFRWEKNGTHMMSDIPEEVLVHVGSKNDIYHPKIQMRKKWYTHDVRHTRRGIGTHMMSDILEEVCVWNLGRLGSTESKKINYLIKPFWCKNNIFRTKIHIPTRVLLVSIAFGSSGVDYAAVYTKYLYCVHWPFIRCGVHWFCME